MNITLNTGTASTFFILKRNIDEIKCYGLQEFDNKVCSSNGVCLKNDNCFCRNNYGGFECQFTTCNNVNSTSNRACSGRGKCIGYNTCDCNQHYSGFICELTKCFGKIFYLNILIFLQMIQKFVMEKVFVIDTKNVLAIVIILEKNVN
jgi:hypothetical protein